MFCSRACFDRDTRKLVERRCTCGKLFTASKARIKLGSGNFCSMACWYAAALANPDLPGIPPKFRVLECEYCGKKVLTQSKTRQFCSRRCRACSRIGTGAKCKMLSDLEAAYVAGLFDGEGNVSLWRSCSRGRGNYAFKTHISNTNLDILYWLQELTGIGYIRMAKPAKPNHKPCGVWICYTTSAAGLLRQLLPYLKIKGRQTEIVLEFQRRSEDPTLGDDIAWREAAYQTVRALNKRGK